jgi:hypothetical protein
VRASFLVERACAVQVRASLLVLSLDRDGLWQSVSRCTLLPVEGGSSLKPERACVPATLTLLAVFAASLAKARATRIARGTAGKQQKALIKAPPPVATTMTPPSRS